MHHYPKAHTDCFDHCKKHTKVEQELHSYSLSHPIPDPSQERYIYPPSQLNTYYLVSALNSWILR